MFCLSVHQKPSFNSCVITLAIFLIDFIYLFIYLSIGCVGSSVAVRGLSLVAEGFSLQWLLLLRSIGSRRAGFSSCGTRASVVVARGLQSAGSVVVAHGLRCSMACGIFPDQGSNP